MGTSSFTSVKGLRPKKNRFNKSYLKAFPSTMGKLVPVHTDFIIPGTWVEMKSSLFTRTQALVAPVMDNISTYVHYWKVPIRLVDEKFTKFIGGEIAPEEYNPAYFQPFEFTGYPENAFLSGDVSRIVNLMRDLPFYNDLLSEYGDSGSNSGIPRFSRGVIFEENRNSCLLDLLGFSGDDDFWTDSECILNLYEFKAYLLLLKVWYTNENITIHMPLYVYSRGNKYTQDGDTLPEVIEDFMTLEGKVSYEFGCLYRDLMLNFGPKALFNHAWAKDYFTSALPNTQYGEEVTIPVLNNNQLVNISEPYITDNDGMEFQSTNGNSIAGQTAEFDVNNNGSLSIGADGARLSSVKGSNLQGRLQFADELPAISILELRIAETLQVYKERIMRAGRKYREYLRMFFDVISSDARLQDPEWLGGGKVALQVGDIEQTSATDSVSPQGNLAGKGTQFGANFAGFKTWCEEWCIIIGVGYMQPKARYCQGIERNKLKTNDLYDWFNPTFERIGEQPIKMVELYAGADVTDSDVFGYQRRYAEYTFKNDQMHGAFKNSLSFWTAGLRIFDSKPALNQQFIYVQPGVFDRIFAVAEAENDGNVLFWWQHAYYVKQPVSKFGTPGLHLY